MVDVRLIGVAVRTIGNDRRPRCARLGAAPVVCPASAQWTVGTRERVTRCTMALLCIALLTAGVASAQDATTTVMPTEVRSVGEECWSGQ